MSSPLDFLPPHRFEAEDGLAGVAIYASRNGGLIEARVVETSGVSILQRVIAWSAELNEWVAVRSGTLLWQAIEQQVAPQSTRVGQ